jgi:hypothetical protein
MGTVKVRGWSGAIWNLAESQHGVVSRAQLVGLGMSQEAIRQRLGNGRLHRVMAGVYAIGRPQLDERGRWMAAVLACGPSALLARRSAATLWGIRKATPGPIEVVTPAAVRRRRSGLHVYRRLETHSLVARCGRGDARDAECHLLWRKVDGIPVTSPTIVLVDLATCLPDGQLEASVSEADHLELVEPVQLRADLDRLGRRPGLVRLRRLLDTATHTLTTTELERLFLPLVARAGLPAPTTQQQLGPNRVDFHWPGLGLVVETDSLRYHRTAFKQSADKRRDNANARLGLITLRFTHGHVRYDPAYVLGELRATARTLDRKAGPSLGS